MPRDRKLWMAETFPVPLIPIHSAVLPTRPKNGEISAQASLAALSPLIIKSKQKALLKTIKSLIKLYQMSTFPPILY